MIEWGWVQIQARVTSLQDRTREKCSLLRDLQLESGLEVLLAFHLGEDRIVLQKVEHLLHSRLRVLSNDAVEEAAKLHRGSVVRFVRHVDEAAL